MFRRTLVWIAPKLRLTLYALMALPLLAAQRPAAGQVIYSTGFEDPPFAKGSQLVGQDGWIAPRS